MPTTAPPPPAHQAPAAEPASARRTSWWDPLTLIVLGLAGGALSYDALRQMAVAVHIRPHLAYLFPLVIDGFIAYGVRALLVLRDAPWPARAYAWTLLGTATAASLWANALHAVRLNQPGVRTLTLGNHTVAVLSAIAPLALAGATHMHILIGRHTSSRPPTAGTPTMIPADPTMIPAEEHTTPSQDEPASQPAARLGTAAGTEDRTPPELAGITGQDDERPVQKLNSAPGERPQTGRGGRKAEASIQQLADIIHRAHPDSGQTTRAMARQAIEAQGISAGNERITEALKSLQPSEQARPHPSNN
ncbi:DUF2637 domain-containing protein [Actinacidiphila paucisporea]|uniref:DUF2637 domain-containing protein n=1 Tax=Actinacidiphila paucisporea TaxID=310782 RepID=A0A1M7QXM3_9ACTN|nr:DUF2637 domain-containing protein [Actinacidiphila paucisporea]SHN36500.1 Protein of unknown function [Actinacidiphila paucisporea]